MASEDQKVDRLVALATAYRAHLDEVRTLVRESLGGIETGRPVSGDLSVLRETVHKIAGSAAIYDYEQVGDAAQETEAAIIDRTHSSTDDATLVRLTESLQRLLDELNGALNAEPRADS